MADVEDRKPLAPADSHESAFVRFTSEPVSLLQTVATMLFALAFVSALANWAIGGTRVSLQVPLLLLGLVAIVLLVITIRKGFALGVALLMIGTVVTTEDFLIKISHLLRQGGKIETYLATQPATPGMSPDQFASLAADRLVAAFGREVSDSIGREKIENLLQETEIDRLIVRLNRSRSLTELYQQPEGWQSIVDTWKNTDAFENDVAKLTKEGLIVCPGGPEFCKLTNLGNRVAKRAEETGQLWDRSAFGID